MTKSSRSPSRWRWLFWLAGLALLVVIGFGVLTYADVAKQRARGMTFWADIFLWYPDGRVKALTDGDGVWHFANIRQDGKRIVYEGGTTGSARLWEHDLETGTTEAITPDDCGSLHPNYSWDGKRIVFVSDCGTDQEPFQVEQIPMKGMYDGHRFHIFVMDAATHETRQLTSGPQSDFRPSFSPDGETIVFSRSQPGGVAPFRLWTVKADGSEEAQPLAFDGPAYNAWYAVDGKSIFFHAYYQGREHACRFTLGEEMPVALPNDTFERTHGEFADPNGELLMVHAVRDGQWGMWELPLDGGEARRIQVPGLETGMHGSRSLDGITVFDVERTLRFKSALRWRWDRLFDGARAASVSIRGEKRQR